jgi:hypothetical protein
MVVANTPILSKEAPRMRRSRQERFRHQVHFLRRQFLQDGDLPFTNVLTQEVLTQALAAVTGWLDLVFSPLVTLGVFLGQVLGADHSGRAAVAHRLAPGQRPCSAPTGASCQARKRLIDFHQRHTSLRHRTFFDGRSDERGLKDVSWHGCRLNEPGWDDPTARAPVASTSAAPTSARPALAPLPKSGCHPRPCAG